MMMMIIIILKFKGLTIEIQLMWKVKTRVIPVIIGATGTISKSFRKYTSNIPGNHEVKELQKTAILGLIKTSLLHSSSVLLHPNPLYMFRKQLASILRGINMYTQVIQESAL